MPRVKRPTRPTRAPAAPVPPSAGALLKDARRELRQARELKRTMAQIRRARLAHEAEGIALARVLCAGTEYTVVGELELREVQHRARELEAIAAERERELVALKRQLNPDAL